MEMVEQHLTHRKRSGTATYKHRTHGYGCSMRVCGTHSMDAASYCDMQTKLHPAGFTTTSSITRCSHIVADTQAMPSIFFLNPLAPNQALRTTCPAHQLGLSLNAPLLNMPAGYLALLLSQCACPHSNNKLGHISTIVNSHTTSTIILQALSQASHSDVHRH